MLRFALFIVVFFGGVGCSVSPIRADPGDREKEPPAYKPPVGLDAVCWYKYAGFEVHDDLSCEIKSPPNNFLEGKDRANGRVYVKVSGEALSTKDLTTLLDATNILGLNCGTFSAGYESGCQLDAEHLRVIAAATQLEALDITLAKAVTTADLQCLESLTKLRYLRLNTFWCRSLNFDWLAKLPNLELLSIDKSLSANTLTKVLEQSPLQYLRVGAQIEPASDKVLEALSKCQTLTSLKWEGTVYLAGKDLPFGIRRLSINVGPDPESVSFATIFDKVKDLECLILNSSYEEGADDLVASKIGSLGKLRFLWIYDWSQLTDKLFAKMCCAPRLERLKLGVYLFEDGWGLSNAAIQAINKNPALVHLDIKGCERITDTGIEALAAGKRDSLRSLALLNCSALTKKSLVALAGCNALRELTFDAENLTDSDLEALELCPVTYLWLHSGINLTPSCLGHLASMKNLETLDLMGCPNIKSSDCAKAFGDRKVMYTTEQ